MTAPVAGKGGPRRRVCVRETDCRPASVLGPDPEDVRAAVEDVRDLARECREAAMGAGSEAGA